MNSNHLQHFFPFAAAPAVTVLVGPDKVITVSLAASVSTEAMLAFFAFYRPVMFLPSAIPVEAHNLDRNQG